MPHLIPTYKFIMQYSIPNNSLKCVRILKFAPFNSHTNQLFIDLKFLKVKDIINTHQLKLVYDYFMNNLPIDLTSLFSLSSEVHTTNLDLISARKNLLHISKINTETYGNKSIKHHWNETFKNGIVINSNPHKNLSVTDIISKEYLKNTICLNTPWMNYG